MDAAKKSFEIQSQIRNNAEDFKNTLNDLYSWEKQIKDKEQKLQQHSTVAAQDAETPPVRSHVLNAPDKQQTTAVDNPTEKCEIPIDPNEEKRKQANIVKDQGNKHVKLGDYEKAMQEYTAAIDIFSEDAVFYSNRALCLLKMARYDECIKDCDRATDLDKFAVKAYYRRMQANESLGNNMDALRDCTTILMIDSKNAEAGKSLERINEKLRTTAKSTTGPNFSAARKDLIDILPIDKPPYSRSKKPLRRVPVTDVVGPKDTKNHENSNIQVSDEMIDKLFNSDCGSFVEVKKPQSPVKKLEIKEIAATETVATKKVKLPVVAAVVEEKIDSNKKSPVAIEKSIVSTTNTATNLLNTNRPLPMAPTSTAQFYSNWKELSAAQKYHYLKSIEVTKLCKILGAGFDSDTLTDVMHTLHEFYVPNKEPNLAATLLEVSKNNQVTILSLLMSSDDHKAISEILNYIKEGKSNSMLVASIAKNFNLH